MLVIIYHMDRILASRGYAASFIKRLFILVDAYEALLDIFSLLFPISLILYNIHDDLYMCVVHSIMMSTSI